MKRYIKNFMMAMMVGATVFGSSCTDSFEEVNTDPDSPTDVPTTNLLAYSLYYTSYRLYDRWFAMDEPMTFCGYASKMTYIDESRYNFRTGVQDTNWEYLYRILNNLKDIENQPNYTFVKADICDFDKMLELFKQYRIDGVIHLAAESHVDRSIKDPFTFAQTNVMGTLTLLQAAKIYWESLSEGYGGKRFYHISTDEVYGALELTHPEGIDSDISAHEVYGDEFFKETTKYNPHSPYSASKAGSDHFVRAFHDTYGMPTVVTNCSNNYGPYQFPEKLIPLFINNIRHRKPLPVYGKGENVRDWLYVVDHAQAIDVIFHHGKISNTYNIGGFNEWKNIDIIKVIIKTVDKLLGYPEGYSLDLITYVTDRKGHDLRYAIDSTKLKSELGWEPSLQFEEGIEETVRWYLDNQEWMDNITSGEYEKYYEEMYNK